MSRVKIHKHKDEYVLTVGAKSIILNTLDILDVHTECERIMNEKPKDAK